MEEETVNKEDFTAKLQAVIQDIKLIADENRHDVLQLLALLRQLEQIHRHIRTEMFETSLPETRNDLYQFVKDIEEKGGWPYIERMKLGQLLQEIESAISEENEE
ncbi:hypothetical protein Xen7305DRAFT_00031500 [Xenococcus sp. PCC 7305]|uniref:hypothetical protein n=1 Tax=Xenococcus sp. PCC 7305 TaxID=102125 RepID=UPI0002AC1CA6|nr:hypothetical protein [Xenococcus sp. PCC 7305]ELS03426.1 hypothetical protein Xen7305DRAFT_00031500 [Xenococcus sp. PCC 7305]